MRIVISKTVDNWARVITNFRPAVSTIIGKVTNDAYALSQLTVPVRRPDVVASTGITGGFLKNSGQVTFNSGALEGEVRYHAYYAGYVHEGTYKMAARPFLSDVVDQLQPVMLMAFRQLESRL